MNQEFEVIILSGFEGPSWNRAIGPYVLCHYLRKNNYNSRVIDFVNHIKEKDLDLLLEKFVSDKTKIIGISTTFMAEQNGLIDNIHDIEQKIIPDHVLNSIHKIKKKFSKLKVVAGGSRSVNVKNYPGIDIVLHGFAEDEMIKLLKNLDTPNMIFYPKVDNVYSIEGKNTDYSIEHSNFRFTDHDVILPKETIPIEISRGCIFKCRFCSYPLTGKKKFDYLRDPKLIAEEMQINYEKWGITNYILTDDTFNDSTYKLEQLHKEFSNLKFKINFVSYIRLDLIKAHPEQAQLLKEMGLMSAFFGLETLNQESAKSVGKGANVVAIKEFLPKLYYDYWNKDISVFSSFIVGLPYETVDSIKSTFRWLEQYKDFNPGFWPLSFRKGYYLSEFEKDPAKYGYQIEGEAKWKSPWMTSETAWNLVHEANEIFQDQTVNTWLTASLLSHGYNMIELKSMKINSINFKNLYKEKIKMINFYKNQLLLL